VEAELLRPALIASTRILRDYSAFIEHFLVGLADQSVLSALVCPGDFDAGAFVSPAVEIIRHPAYRAPFFWRQSRRRLYERLTEFGPTVLHCLDEHKAGFTIRLAKRLDLPCVVTVNSLQKRFSRFSFYSKFFSAFIVPAESIASNITGLRAGLTGRVEQINLGTFVQERSGCFSTVGAVASMVTIYRADYEGDFGKLLDAVKRLAIDGYEFMLVVAAQRRAEAALRRLLASRGLSQISIVIPLLRLQRKVLAAGDIFIQPWPSDTFNVFLLDAMGVGTAVAACRGGVDDLIIDGETAVVFDPADELSIYDCLRQLFDRPERARQLARAALGHLKENYTVTGMVSSTLRIYRAARERFENKMEDD